MFIGISLKCVYPIMVEEGDLWCSDFCKIYLSVKYLLYPLAKFSPRLSSPVWIGFEHAPLYIQPPTWLILLPPHFRCYYIFFFISDNVFFHNIDPSDCAINTKTNSSKLNKLKSVRKSDPPPLHITHPFLTPTLGIPLYGLLHVFTKQSWATSSIIFQKSQLPLYIRKRCFTIRSSPRQRKFTHSPRPHFSK